MTRESPQGNGVSRRDVLKAGATVAGAAGVGAVETELTYAQEETTVTIRRDEFGVPHVYAREAESRAPVFYGYGYATAQDRLYQLELYRRYYHGTVAEVLGPGEDGKWIEFDREARRNTAGEPPLDEQAAAQLTADQRGVLQAFTDGINRYISEVRKREDLSFHRGFQENGLTPSEFSLGEGGSQFEITGKFQEKEFEPEPFATEDTAGLFVGSMAFFSGFQLETLGATVLDLLRAETDEERATALFEELQPGDSPGSPTSTVQPEAGYSPPYTAVETGEIPTGSGPRTAASTGATVGDDPARGASGPSASPSNRVTGGDAAVPTDATGIHEAEVERMRTLAAGLDDLGLPIKYGSNALAVQGELTESGDALLMGGPQMGFNTPSIMYEAGLHGPDFDVAGVTVAGYPFIMFGHNRNGAMTSTAGIDNCIQTFRESVTVTEDGPDTYTFRGGEREVETEVETITVAGEKDVTYTERFTRHGVITGWDPENGEALAQTRSYAGRHMSCWRAFYECQFAEDAEAFTEAAQRCDYALNFTWAGTSGDIAYVHLGRYPDAESVPWDTRLPADGTQYELTDDDYLRAADGEVPYAINPEPGYSAQWNNKPAPGWANGDLSYSWTTDHRVQRLINLVEHRLDEQGTLDYAFLKEVVYDIAFTDLRSIRYKRAVLDALAGADLTETEEQARDELAAWGHFAQADGEDDTGQYPAGYAVWDETFGNVVPELFQDAFGGAYGPASFFLTYRYGRGALMRLLNPEETALDLGAEYASDVDGALVTAFKTAVSDLAEQYDGPPATWRRSADLQTFDNLALFGMPIGVTTAGETALMNRGTENHVVRLRDPPVAENVLPPGNDGYVAPDGSTGEHYDDQLSLFAAFEYKRLLFGDDEVRANTTVARELRRTAGDPGTDDTDTEGTETPASDDSTETTGTATPETPSADDEGPGFTALTGAVAVLGSVFVWLRNRERQE